MSNSTSKSDENNEMNNEEFVNAIADAVEKSLNGGVIFVERNPIHLTNYLSISTIPIRGNSNHILVIKNESEKMTQEAGIKDIEYDDIGDEIDSLLEYVNG